MSPADARDALAGAFPGMEWTVAEFSSRITGAGPRNRPFVIVDGLPDGRWLAWVGEFHRQRATSKWPVRAVRQAIANARAHLTAQLAALDAATETP